VPAGLSSRDAERQKLSDISGSNETLKTVFGLLRESNEVEAAEIVRRIRTADDVGEALRSVQDASALLGRAPPIVNDSQYLVVAQCKPPALPGETIPPATRPSQYGSPKRLQSQCASHHPTIRRTVHRVTKSKRRYDNPGHFFESRFNVHVRGPATLDDVVVKLPGKRLPVSRWTTVSNDDDLLTHLLTLFWTWDNVGSRVLCQQSFTDELMEGAVRDESPPTSRFCTPFLVNAVLALASVRHSQRNLTLGMRCVVRLANGR
jgi:hypothetical protein